MANDTGSDLGEFVNSLPSFVRQAERNIHTDNIHTLEFFERRLDDYSCAVRAVISCCLEIEYLHQQLVQLYILLRYLCEQYQERCFLHRNYSVELGYICPVERSGNQGRPRYNITPEVINTMQNIHSSWKTVAQEVGVSYRTLLRRRHLFGQPVGSRDTYSSISQESLIAIVREVLELVPNAGETYVIGALRGRGVHVQRWRIRDTIQEVDPVSRSLRRTRAIIRRRYNVVSPNALWHIDGHHKLIRWRLVIHGGIDGYSRCIVYLLCSNNNRAETVTSLFLSAIEAYGLPSRVRSDFGTENTGVAMFMLEHPHRGPNRGSVITGSSVHNQRIERLWLEVKKNIVTYYRNIFYYLEQCELLDALNDSHLFALHYVFLPRINRSLNELFASWNNHPMRTANNRSPLQLWYSGLHAVVMSNSSAVQSLMSDNTNWNDYGIDEHISNIDTDNNVNVPEIPIQISENETQEIQQHINPLADDGNHGINLYQLTLAALQELTLS